MSENFLKIVSAEIKNFQTLEHVKVDIAGKSIAIVGRNGGGKSSLLRAIQSPLDAKFRPAQPIKDGEERASVFVKLKGQEEGEEVEYNYSVVFTGKNKKGNIVVTDSQGNAIKSKDIQQDIIGNVAFNIDEFINLGLTSTGKPSTTGIAKQIEVLRQFLTKEERVALNTFDADIAKQSEIQKESKKEADKLEAQAKETMMDEFEMEKYSVDKTKEIEEIKTQMGNIEKERDAYDQVTSKVEKLTETYKELSSFLENKAEIEKFVESLDKIEPLNLSFEHPTFSAFNDITKASAKLKEYLVKAKSVNEQLTESNENIAKGKAWLEGRERPSISSLSEQLQELMNHQEMNAKVSGIRSKWVESQRLRKEAEEAKKEIAKLKEEKKKIFASGSLPVQGLEFDEETGITYNGLPFNQDHHPTSLILSIGAKIAMKMNPNLKCIFIKDGSMFDQKTLKGLLSFIEREGYQLMIEMVDWTGEKEVSIEFTEEFLG